MIIYCSSRGSKASQSAGCIAIIDIRQLKSYGAKYSSG